MPGRINLQGRTIVITGATGGIGLATAVELAKRGASIIGTGRNSDKCAAAAGMVQTANPSARVAFEVADLSSLTQVRQLAARIRARLASEDGVLDVLINNAGTFSSWFTLTPDGFEQQLAVNHLAPFLLTHELLPSLRLAPSARIITVSSGSHYWTKLNWNDLQMRKHYGCLRAYKRSKLANVLFTAELNRRLGPESAIRAYAADPGLVNTEIGLKNTAGLARWVWARRRRSGGTVEQGAATSVYLASASVLPDEEAIYWRDCRPRRPSRYSLRPDAARRLWVLSERMCGIERN